MYLETMSSFLSIQTYKPFAVHSSLKHVYTPQRLPVTTVCLALITNNCLSSIYPLGPTPYQVFGDALTSRHSLTVCLALITNNCLSSIYPLGPTPYKVFRDALGIPSLLLLLDVLFSPLDLLLLSLVELNVISLFLSITLSRLFQSAH
jgi:hypothetical protein